MAAHEPLPPRDNPEVAHEASDVNIKAIAGFALGLGIAAVVIHFALYWLLNYYSAREARLQESITVIEQTDEAPPAPRLQVAPQADLAELRAAEERMLQSYGWVDREKSTVRIPIDRAMEIIAEKGLPARKKAREEKTAQNQKPAETAKDVK